MRSLFEMWLESACRSDYPKKSVVKLDVLDSLRSDSPVIMLIVAIVRKNENIRQSIGNEGVCSFFRITFRLLLFPLELPCKFTE